MAKKQRSRAGRASDLASTPPGSEAVPESLERRPEQLREEEIERALAQDDPQYRGMLRSYFGAPLYDELRELSARSREAAVRGGPKVLILPGIMGSTLGYRRSFPWDDVIWVDPVDIGRGRLMELKLRGSAARGIEPLGVITYAYLPLKLRLRWKGLDADYYPYDWRQSIEVLGKQLAEHLASEPAAEVYLVGHSMGGLVARSALAQAGDGVQRKVKRLIMLGTPNHGSFSPVLVLRNQHSIVQWLGRIDLTHDAKTLLEDLIREFPSLYEMLPTREVFSAVDLYSIRSWPVGGADVPRPLKGLLERVPEVQGRLAQADERFQLIAGVEQETIFRLEVEQGRFHYYENTAGDGTVPLDFARLRGMTTYHVKEAHDKLPGNRTVADAVADLVNSGASDLFPTKWMPREERAAGVDITIKIVDEQAMQERARAAVPDRRGPAELSPEARRDILRGFVAPPDLAEAAPPIVAAPLVTVPTAAPPTVQAAEVMPEEPLEGIVIARRRQFRMEVRLALGSITDVKATAYVLGMYEGVTPSGPAAIVDRLMDGAVSEMVTHRLFSPTAGQVFVLPTGRHPLYADLIVFAGLGPFDRLDNSTQEMVAASVYCTLANSGVWDFATLLFGANSATSVRQTLANLVTGFFRVARDHPEARRLPSITLCEIDPGRYAEMRTELLRLASTPLFEDVEITLDEIRPTPVIMREPQAPTPLADEAVYLLVRQVQVQGDKKTGHRVTLGTSVLDAGGKATVLSRDVQVEQRDLDQLLAQIKGVAKGQVLLTDFGRRLGELALHSDIRAALRSLAEHYLVVVHDNLGSKIPWEAIDLGGHQPAAGRGMSRMHSAENLSVAKWLERRRLDPVLRLLLVVNPTADLPGAEEEGKRVLQLFSERGRGVRVNRLRGPEATYEALQHEFSSGQYDVLHYAGHATFDPYNRERSGIICHGGKQLTGADLAGLGQLPSLVFFNACEAGRIRRLAPTTVVPGLEIPREIADNIGLAEAFLRGGVANYLGTYWPVGDAAAKAFAAAFYEALLSARPIGEALRLGRDAVRRLGSPDWADYVHYGHHGFRIKLVSE